MATNVRFGAFCMRQGSLLIPVYASGINVTEEVTSENALQFPLSGTGTLQVAEVLETQSTYNIEVTSQVIDLLSLTWFFGQKSGSETIVVPDYRIVTVPVSAPYEVTITGLTVDQPIEVTQITAVAPGSTTLAQIASSGIPTTGQFEVTANTISFNAAQAGASMGVYYKSSQVLANGYGGTLNNPMGSFEFFCKFRSTRLTGDIKLWFPSCTLSGGFNLGSGGDDIARPIVATLPPGWQVPYKAW